MLEKNSLAWIFLSLVVVVIDQAAKYGVSHSFLLYESKAILPIFNLTLLYNYGAAFSFLSGEGRVASGLFLAIAVIVSVILIRWLYRLPSHRRWLACALALILGGALGNLTDRIIHGYVIDFFDFHLGQWHFAAFNVADSAITIGAIMLIIDVLLLQRNKRVSRA